MDRTFPSLWFSTFRMERSQAMYHLNLWHRDTNQTRLMQRLFKIILGIGGSATNDAGAGIFKPWAENYLIKQEKI